MFNDRYGLTAAVLQCRKTMTRRIVPTQYVPMIEDGLQGAALIEAQRHGDAYRENEIVAVAQSYETLANSGYLDKMVVPANNPVKCEFKKEYYNPGWSNKMFVRPDLMPHQIQITDIKIERLQDISDGDCLREGVIPDYDDYNTASLVSYYINSQKAFPTPRAAFASLIDRISGKGTWQSNPIVVAYSFRLIK